MPDALDAPAAASLPMFAADLHVPAKATSGPPLRFCVREGDVLIERHGDGAMLPASVPAGTCHVLGTLGDRPCLAIDGTDRAVRPPLEWCDLRTLHALLDETLWGIAGRAVQIVQWDRTHRFCGRCGTYTVPVPGERSRRCPRCGLHAYPRLSPAIITLVTRGEHDERALLAWGQRWPRPMYSTLAGFVEPGETLEETLAREVLEETAIQVTDIRYIGSQAWPFPHQLMVGFRARWAGGEIVAQHSEIRDARWFTPAELEEVSAPQGTFSIAGSLIEGWRSEQAARAGG